MRNCPKCAEKVQDAAIVCKHCGHQFTAEERAALRKGGLGRGLILVAVIGFIIYACTQSGSGGSSGTQTAAPSRPTVAVTAEDLFQEYQANEAAAQARFAGQNLSVSGTVAGVDLDFANDPFVKLATSNEFMPVQAKLADSAKAEAQSLVKGNKVTVTCAEVGEVIGTPVLRDCTIGAVRN